MALDMFCSDFLEVPAVLDLDVPDTLLSFSGFVLEVSLTLDFIFFAGLTSVTNV